MGLGKVVQAFALAVVVTSGLVWAGCASTGFLMAQPKVILYVPDLPAKPIDAAIDIFESQKPEGPYQEVAKIEVADTDDKWCMGQILKKAREIGADGVLIVGRSGSYGVGLPFGGGYAAIGAYGMVAIAFRYK